MVHAAEVAKGNGEPVGTIRVVVFEGMDAQQLLTCRHLWAFSGARAPVLIRVTEHSFDGISHPCLLGAGCPSYCWLAEAGASGGLTRGACVYHSQPVAGAVSMAAELKPRNTNSMTAI